MVIVIGKSCGHYTPWIPDQLREFCEQYQHLTFTVRAAVTCCSLSIAHGHWIDHPDGGNHGTRNVHGALGYRDHRSIPPSVPCNLESLCVSVKRFREKTEARAIEVQHIWHELADRRFPGHRNLGSYTTFWSNTECIDFRMYVLEDAEALRGLMYLLGPPSIWAPSNHNAYLPATRDRILYLFACWYHGETLMPVELMVLLTEQYVAA